MKHNKKDMNMNIRLLKIFQVVAKHESITAAAKELYLTQPAVSNAILQLEESLETSLFDRLSKRIFLNEAGKSFLNKTNEVLKQYEDLSNHFKDSTIKLRIGSSITIAKYLLPKIIKTIHDEMDVRVFVDNAKSIEKKLLSNEIDIGLIEGVLSNQDLISDPLNNFQLAFFCHQDHPVSKKKEISIEELIQEKFLSREQGSSIRDVLDGALLMLNKKIEPYWESINSEVLIAAVKENLGVCLLPKIMIEHELNSKEFVEFKVKDLELFNYAQIVYHKDKQLSESTRILINSLIN